MKSKYVILTGFLFILLAFISCQNEVNKISEVGNNKSTPILKTSAKTELKTISIQPFSDLSPQLSNYVFKELKKIYPLVELNSPIPLPKSAYYTPRSRYRADLLIAYLDKIHKKGHVIIGLTGKDISTTKGEVYDWGVMGLGYKPGNACVVSTYRLDKKNLKDQLFKVSVHELGHTQSLSHCPNPTCFMRAAEGGNPTVQETGFCPKCMAVLVKKGWQFK